MKRFFIVGLILALLLETLFCGVALATHASGTCGENVTWWYDSHVGALTIEGTGEMYDYYNFNDISWYSLRTDFYSIVVESGVSRIGYNAFLDCISVTSVSLPSSVTAIGDMAFRNCSSLVSITIPEQTASIGDYAFRDCSALTEIVLPSSVASIGSDAFYGCTALASVIILNPDAVIGDSNYDVFRDCSADLVLYGLQNSTAEAYAAAAGLCFKALTLSGSCGTDLHYVFDPYSGRLSIFGSRAMTDYYSYQQVPWFDFREKITTLSISLGVTRIGHLAFSGCTGLTSVMIPENVKSIGVYAFNNCVGMTSIIIPKSVTTIDEYAFRNCNKLARVYYSGTVDQWEAIEINTDGDGNESLTSATLYCDVPPPTFRLPASLTTIGEEAFSGINAEAVWIPSTVKSISGNPFADSDVQYIYGATGTLANTFARYYDYFFVPCDD